MLQTARELRTEIEAYVNQLSGEHLQVVLDLVVDLAQREAEEATQELLAVPGFLKELQEAEREAETGDLEDWRGLRDDL
jgi:hypothetical protein